MRIGYSYWGYLADVKLDEAGNEVSTPDGNATYSWSIIWEAQRRGHRVYMMQQDRDAVGWRMHGDELFSAFSGEKRRDAYLGMSKTDGHSLPELDVLLLEWRFPIPGRNTIDCKGRPGYQPDLERQLQLLRHYSDTNTKVILWDLDHKLKPLEEAFWDPHAVFETSVRPLHYSVPRTRVEPPIVTEDLLQFRTVEQNPLRKLVYVGSRYERDDVITEFVKPASDAYPGQVEFWGNWLNSLDECRSLWPNVSFNKRITTRDFRDVYRDAVACPLLAKRSYIETGFITPRPWEAIMFGTLPIGLSPMVGIDDYVLTKVDDGEQMVEALYELSQLTMYERDVMRHENAHMLGFMDACYFVDEIEDVANGFLNMGAQEAGNG